MIADGRAERLAQLRERASHERPEAWRPAAGDTLAGELLRYETGHTGYSGEVHIAIVRDELGIEHAFWLLHSVAVDEFKKLRPAPGELLAIHYVGRRTNSSGQAYEAFRVVVDREPADLADAEPADHEGPAV